jgi:gamma-glutamyl:cysteine ligase YbdK (ATP-grasp superfamily)
VSGPTRSPWHLFDGTGVEIEYAIVDAHDLSVRPIADVVLRDENDEPTSEVEHETTCWSNELTAHVLELKTRGPTADLARAAQDFAGDVRTLDARLHAEGAQLMPTAMHPLMNPKTDTRLWPHEQSDVYQTYDRVFGCRGHGWANVQSVHLNLPFAGDAEFARLHAAVRVILPLLPALAASSPIVEGRLTGRMDTRLWYYRGNQRAVPVVTARVIPEPVFTKAAYDETILQPIARALEPLDPERTLEPEWVNSRGAIARFSRGSIEIRLLDVQECPSMDLAIAGLVVATVRALVDERLSSFDEQRSWSVDRLFPLLLEAETVGSDATFASDRYASLFGMPPRATRATAVVEHLAGRLAPAWSTAALEHLLTEGCLARRVARATGESPTRDAIVGVYRQLCACLRQDTPFSG